MNRAEVSRATLGRVPMYLKYLKDKNDPGGNISATALAKELGLGDVQVRKDLAAVSALLALGQAGGGAGGLNSRDDFGILVLAGLGGGLNQDLTADGALPAVSTGNLNADVVGLG